MLEAQVKSLQIVKDALSKYVDTTNTEASNEAGILFDIYNSIEEVNPEEYFSEFDEVVDTLPALCQDPILVQIAALDLLADKMARIREELTLKL